MIPYYNKVKSAHYKIRNHTTRYHDIKYNIVNWIKCRIECSVNSIKCSVECSVNSIKCRIEYSVNSIKCRIECSVNSIKCRIECSVNWIKCSVECSAATKIGRLPDHTLHVHTIEEKDSNQPPAMS